jgi:hypothetical protein
MMLNTHIHLVQRLRISGAKPQNLHEVDRDNSTFTIFLLFLNYLCIFLHYSLFIYVFIYLAAGIA